MKPFSRFAMLHQYFLLNQKPTISTLDKISFREHFCVSPTCLRMKKENAKKIKVTHTTTACRANIRSHKFFQPFNWKSKKTQEKKKMHGFMCLLSSYPILLWKRGREKVWNNKTSTVRWCLFDLFGSNETWVWGNSCLCILSLQCV